LDSIEQHQSNHKHHHTSLQTTVTSQVQQLQQLTDKVDDLENSKARNCKDNCINPNINVYSLLHFIFYLTLIRNFTLNEHISMEQDKNSTKPKP
ncbi:Hypothetical predicted protein, partial [Pelobates cultripes]